MTTALGLAGFASTWAPWYGLAFVYKGRSAPGAFSLLFFGAGDWRVLFPILVGSGVVAQSLVWIPGRSARASLLAPLLFVGALLVAIVAAVRNPFSSLESPYVHSLQWGVTLGLATVAASVLTAFLAGLGFSPHDRERVGDRTPIEGGASD